jgi:hypothetical protein
VFYHEYRERTNIVHFADVCYKSRDAAFSVLMTAFWITIATASRGSVQEIELGRNDPCHCGSGKKYMHCCRRKDLKAKAALRAAERPKADLPEPVAATEPIPSEPPVLPEPPEPPPPDPRAAAFNAHWEAFEAQDYAGQIALFLQTVDEEELMDEEMAFEMLNSIYYQSVEREEQDRFDALVDRLRERLPAVYAHDAHYYLDWRITNALATDQVDALPDLVNEMAPAAGKNIDTFFNVLDRLAYHGHLSVLVEATRLAWPKVKESDGIVQWGIDEFTTQAADYEVFDYLERHSSPDANDPELLGNLAFYLKIDPERFARYMGHLTGQVERRWTMDDFRLERLNHHPGVFFDEDDEEDQELDEGRQNLFDLSVEFLGYLRREEGVAYTKGELGREQIRQYIQERHAGELEPQESPFEAMRRPKGRRRKRKSRKPRHVLCPDRGTLDRFLGGLLGFINPQHYKAAATLELMPAWLRFLESRQLIDDEQRAKTMSDLRGLDTELRKVWGKSATDPALLQGLEGWRDE